MFNRPARAPVGQGLLALLACIGVAACGMHWPWKHHAKSAPQPVNEVSIQPAADAGAAASSAILQFWDRNTLLLDLTAVGSEGAVTLSPTQHGWPVRLEFRVQPGSMTALEVLGRVRVLFEVPSQGKPVVLKLSPDAYVHNTPQIT